MRLIRGRLMNQTGGEVMINEAFARVRFGVEDPIGQYLKPANAPDTWNGWLVVGILADVRPTVRSPATYRVYGPETWWPPAMTTLMVRAAQAPDGSLISAVRRAIYEVDARLVPAMVVPLVKWQDWQVANERFAAGVLKVLSAIALLLTVVGLFSVLAYTVDRRMNEFGVRLALGATSRNLVMLVLRRGLGLTLFGVVLGLAGAWALSRFLQSLLFETPRHDPVVLGAVSLVLLSAAVVACALPAQRATRVDVARLLRAE